MIIGTAGHVDHGKSALVRALTGTDPDRLKEERARGISIDLGFACRTRPDGAVTGFVDVPGHERLVHTMLAGAHGIDRVLLAVAADDGVMPQTREHLAILELLGVTDAVVALTKTDLVPPERVAAVAAEVAALLAATPFAGAPVLPVSVVSGAGMAALAGALDEQRPRARGGGRFRLAVDRCFALAGAGTVVTGTVLSGAVAVGDPVVVSPAGLAARVRGLHRHDRPASAAAAGERCAMNLAGPGIARDAIARGDMVLDPALHAPTRRIDARIRVLAGERKGLGPWAPVRLHHAAAAIPAHVVPLEAAVLGAGESGFAQLVLDQPLAAACGDRLVLRDTAASRTLGGGVILDLRAPERRRRTPGRIAVLTALDAVPGAPMLEALAGRPPHAVDVAAFLRDHAMTGAEGAALLARAAVVRLPGAGTEHALAPAVWAALRRAIVAALRAAHDASPGLPGLAVEALRAGITPLLAAAPFQAALAAMQRDGEIAVTGAFVRLPGHVTRLTPAEAALWRAIAGRLDGPGRFRPPRVRDLAAGLRAGEREVRAVLRAVARRGEVFEVAPDHFFLRRTLAEIVGMVDALSAAGQTFAVASFRDRLGEGHVTAGRKVAVQILEFLDRHGVTRRRGDLRCLDRRRTGLFAPAAEEAGVEQGRAASPVGRPDFKSGWGRTTVPGGFDSHSLPPPRPVPPPVPRTVAGPAGSGVTAEGIDAAARSLPFRGG